VVEVCDCLGYSMLIGGASETLRHEWQTQQLGPLLLNSNNHTRQSRCAEVFAAHSMVQVRKLDNAPG
jgi:hypothetical protein